MSGALGGFIGSGGGISLYEPEPAYQQGVQSTGTRTIPDVSLVADPATGAWIADPYNLDPSNPFEVVGGTSLSAPCWASLVALANQGRAAAGEQALDSSSPTDTLQAVYSLPQRDYNVIGSGTNGYSAARGYNLVTGLGTPVANLLISDLVAYHGPGTSYAGPTVAPMQSAALVNTQAIVRGPIDVFSVFDAITLTGNGMGHTWARGASATSLAVPAVGKSSSSVSAQDGNLAKFSEGTSFLASAGERPAPPLVVVPSAPKPGLAYLELALADGGTLFDTTTSSMSPVVRIRLNPAASDSNRKTSRPPPSVPAIDAAALDAVLRAGWRGDRRGSPTGLANRPGSLSDTPQNVALRVDPVVFGKSRRPGDSRVRNNSNQVIF